MVGMALLGSSCGYEQPLIEKRAIPGEQLLGFSNPFHQSIAMQDFVRKHLDQNLLSYVEVKPKKQELQLTQAANTQQGEFEFYFEGIPFCTLGAKVSLLKDESLLLLGRQPSFSRDSAISLRNSLHFGELEGVQALVAENLPHTDFLNTSGDDPIFYDMQKCIFNANQATFDSEMQLLPAYRMHVMHEDLPYFVIANENKILLLEERYFNVKGKARIYDSNPFDNNFTEIEMDGFTGAGTLDTEFFTTTVLGGGNRIQRPDHNFILEEKQEGFAEVHLFFNALRQYKFYEDLGFQWYGPKPLVINVHSNTGAMINNGLYKPGGQPGVPQPSILIGDGDGVTLQNLAFDADVVSHEVNHHMVFKRLKSTSGESLVLHEGLADYFTFARTGNACLGESICPNSDQSICYRPRQCLRTAENTLVLNNTEYRQFGSAEHLKSQLISGFLWDVRQDPNSVAADIDAIAFRAVDLLFQTSGFQDLMVAVLKADQEKDSKYFDLIKTKADARGLGVYLNGLVKGGALPAITGVKQTASSTISATPSSSKSSNSRSGGGGGSGCSVGGNGASSPLFYLLLILSILPRFSRRPSFHNRNRG